MGMLVGQLIKILEQFDQDREVMIHTLSGEIMMDVVDKKKARREAKKHIENELQDQL